MDSFVRVLGYCALSGNKEGEARGREEREKRQAALGSTLIAEHRVPIVAPAIVKRGFVRLVIH